MIELTGEQQRQMKEEGWPPRILNPKTREEFVLIHSPLFERVRHILETEDDIPAIEEMVPFVAEALEGEDSVSRESA